MLSPCVTVFNLARENYYHVTDTAHKIVLQRSTGYVKNKTMKINRDAKPSKMQTIAKKIINNSGKDAEENWVKVRKNRNRRTA